jgi:hypothetical protein
MQAVFGSEKMIAIAVLNAADSGTDAMSHAEPTECANLVVTSSSGHSQRCANPFCNTVIEPMIHGRWRRTQRRFCSDEYRWDAWAIRRLRERLNVLSDLEVLKIISEEQQRELPWAAGSSGSQHL